MKKYLIVYYGDAPECVEGFKKDCKRSCEGALHLMPGQKKTVTEDEYEHIKSHYKHCLPKLRVVSEMMEPKKESKGKAKEQPKKEEPKAEPKEASHSKAHEGKKGKKKK